ncbi:MAG: PRC-barrel domain-containing protein [Reyranellaceae bacterium]
MLKPVLKPVLIAAALTTFGAATVYAAPPSATHPAPTMQDRAGPAIKADKLIGRDVRNAQNETIGEIESIYLGKDGQVDSVIIGVGGFLGIGQRDVRVAWKDLTITDNGEKVTVAMTKDQLKAMPPYKYSDTKYRGKVFTDRGVHRDDTASGRTTTDRPTAAQNDRPTMDKDRTTPPASTATGPTRTFNADGFISTEAVLKASVRNASNDKIGDVEDVYVDKDGKIQTVVVSVGGFLGMGDKNVALNWKDLQARRDGDSLILTSSFTKDQLKSMPKYDYDRQQAEQK